jgi:hypothetical protein
MNPQQVIEDRNADALDYAPTPALREAHERYKEVVRPEPPTYEIGPAASPELAQTVRDIFEDSGFKEILPESPREVITNDAVAFPEEQIIEHASEDNGWYETRSMAAIYGADEAPELAIPVFGEPTVEEVLDVFADRSDDIPDAVAAGLAEIEREAFDQGQAEFERKRKRRERDAARRAKQRAERDASETISKFEAERPQPRVPRHNMDPKAKTQVEVKVGIAGSSNGVSATKKISMPALPDSFSKPVDID